MGVVVRAVPWAWTWAVSVVIGLLLPVLVSANFGFEAECAKSGVAPVKGAKSDAKWIKAVIQAAVPAHDFVNGAVKESIDDAPSLNPHSDYNYLRLEYVVGGPHGLPLTRGHDLCPVLRAFVGMAAARNFPAQRAARTGASITAEDGMAHNHRDGTPVGAVKVQMPTLSCTPQITLGIPHDGVFGFLQHATTAQLQLFSDAHRPVMTTLTAAVDADVSLAVALVSAKLVPPIANNANRLRALIWFLRRYADAFGHGSLSYLKQSTRVLMRSQFAPLARALTQPELAALTALQTHWSATDLAATVCRIAWPADADHMCARKLITASVSEGPKDITITQWITQLFKGTDPLRGASSGSMGVIPYTEAEVVMEFRHTHRDSSPGTLSPWIWSVYDFAAQYIDSLKPPHTAPVWTAQPPQSTGCTLPPEVEPVTTSAGCTDGGCVIAMLDQQHKTQTQRQQQTKAARALRRFRHPMNARN